MKQSYEIWDVVPGRSVFASVEGLIDDWEGFRLLLRDYEGDRMFRITFPAFVAYQNRDESDLHGETVRSDGLGRGCFYRVKNSEFVARFKMDSLRDSYVLEHFAIVTDSDCVDVLATEEPIFEYL